MCILTWAQMEARAWCQNVFLNCFSTLCFETGSHWTWHSLFELAWVASGSLAFACLHPQHCGYRCMSACLAGFSHECQASGLRVSCSPSRHIAYWAISLGPPFDFDKFTHLFSHPEHFPHPSLGRFPLIARSASMWMLPSSHWGPGSLLVWLSEYIQHV